MKRGAAIAVAVAALFAAGEAAACSLVPLDMIFRTAPTAVAAEVTKVRRVWPREWERGAVYIAEFRLIGPTRPRTLPTYRWSSKEECGALYSVRRGERVWLLLESDEVEARRHFAETRTASMAEDPSPVGGWNTYDYDPAMVVYPYTDDLSAVQGVLQDYHPARLYPAPPPPPPPPAPSRP